MRIYADLAETKAIEDALVAAALKETRDEILRSGQRVGLSSSSVR